MKQRELTTGNVGPVKRTRLVTILGLVAVMAMSALACGDDDDETTTEAGDATGEAVAPPPDRAFDNVTTALEAQGLTVTQLERTSLNGAEAGIDISGDRSGAGRSFATETKAHDYAGEVTQDGDKTTIVGTVVFQAATQDDADFFAVAYEG
jgi:hypothetical protein